MNDIVDNRREKLIDNIAMGNVGLEVGLRDSAICM
jgi:hypothetical protein